MTGRILVLGATGVMGRRITTLARRLIPDAEVVGAARRVSESGGDVAVDIHDPDSLAEALTGFDVVINAVGPFDYAPEPLIAACSEASCDLVDIADDTSFITRSRLTVAEDTRIRVVSGCSTVPALVEVLTQRWGDDERVAAVDVTLALGSKNEASPAMLFSLIRPLRGHAPDGDRYFGKIVRKEFPGEVRRRVGRYPSTFDGSGLELGSRWVPARFWVGCDRYAAVLALRIGAPILGLLPDGLVKATCRLAMPVAWLMRVTGSSLGILLSEARDDRDRIVDSLEVRAQRNGLDVPSLPSVWAARSLLDRSRLDSGRQASGAVELKSLVTPEQAEEWLAAEGFVVSRWSGVPVSSR